MENLRLLHFQLVLAFLNFLRPLKEPHFGGNGKVANRGDDDFLKQISLTELHHNVVGLNKMLIFDGTHMHHFPDCVVIDPVIGHFEAKNIPV